jgi:cell division protein FtsZ
METIRAFAAEDATIILGTVYDDSLGDQVRVTVVATGLGRHRKAGPTLVHTASPAAIPRTGTDNVGFPPGTAAVGGFGAQIGGALAGQGASPVMPSTDYSQYDQPTVWRDPRSQAAARVEAMTESGIDRLDIPAFLRKQAD